MRANCRSQALPVLGLSFPSIQLPSPPLSSRPPPPMATRSPGHKGARDHAPCCLLMEAGGPTACSWPWTGLSGSVVRAAGAAGGLGREEELEALPEVRPKG